MRCLMTIALAAATSAPASAQRIKIATLAPAGSAWMQIFEEGARNIKKRTDGRVTFKFYPGGIAGDERDAIRKLKAGQIHATAVTAVGLAQLYKDVRVLELPLMFETDAEVDYVRTKLGPELKGAFEKKGYVLLAWGDVGWVRLATNTPIRKKSDLAQVKMWVWVDDPITRRLFEKMKLNAVALSVPEVLPSLQTGMINGAYGPPLTHLAFQWYTRVKYLTSQPLSYGVGGFIMSKKAYDKMKPADQRALVDESKKLENKLMAQIRQDNADALVALKKHGIKEIDTPKAFLDDVRKSAEQVWHESAGKLYAKSLLDKVMKLRQEHRAKN